MRDSGFIQDTEFRLEKYCAILAVYGSELRRGNSSPVFDDRGLDNSAGRNVSDVVDIMNASGYLEKVYDKSEDNYFHRIPRSDEVRNQAKDISKHIEDRHDGRIYRFLEDFDDQDVKALREFNIGLVQ